MKVILDTNVVLDVLLERKPFVRQAVEIFSLVETSKLEAHLCATTITTIDYLLTQALPADNARSAIWGLLELFEIAVVNRPVIEEALRSDVLDFEDAVLEQAGRIAGVDAVVTRNTKDFRRASLKIFDPTELLSHMTT